MQPLSVVVGGPGIDRRPMLRVEKEVPMARYSGEVVERLNNDFPFLVLIYDGTGKIIGEFPVRTKAEGEEKIIVAIDELGKMAISDEPKP